MKQQLKEQIGYISVALIVVATFVGTWIEYGAGKAFLAAAAALGGTSGTLTLPPSERPPI
jgi:hypothetical protein